jgi:hypothetical protein
MPTDQSKIKENYPGNPSCKAERNGLVDALLVACQLINPIV